MAAARLALVMLLLGAASASADPIVVVRARMRIELEHVERVGRGMVVAGRLLDEGQDEPIGLGTVALKVGLLSEDGSESFRYGSAMAVDEDGGFRFDVPLGAPVRYMLRITAPGTGLHEAAAPVERELDFALRPIELRLFVPAEQPADSLTLPVSVEAVALDRNDVSNGAAEPKAEDDLPVDVDLDGVPTATLVLKGGRASTQLPLHAKPGQEVSVRVRFTGDSTRGPAEATARVRLVEKGVMTLTVEPARVALGSDLKLRGTLRFGERAVGGLPVIVRLAGDDSRPGVSVATDPSGAFEATLRTPDEGTRAGYEAVFRDGDAKARGLPPARSAVLVVELLPGFSLTDLGARPAGAALAIAAALLVILGLLRAGALFATRKATPRPALPPAPHPRATLRTASDRRVSGRVVDDERSTPLAGARVELTVGDDVQAVYTDERGGFVLAPADGDATLLVERQGFAPTKLAGPVPHRGEWAKLEVRLPPLRAELLRRYGAALATSVPSGEALGLRTPRELALVALRHRPTLDAKALRTLRAWIEVSCFGPTSPSADSLERLGKLVDDLGTHSSLPSPPPRP